MTISQVIWFRSVNGRSEIDKIKPLEMQAIMTCIIKWEVKELIRKKILQNMPGSKV